MMSEKNLNFSLFSQKIIDSTPLSIEAKSGIDQSVKSSFLGSVSFIQPCSTCFLTDQCPGHFGKFNINKILFKVAFKKEIEFLLKNICPKCGMIKNSNLKNLLEKIYNNSNIILQEDRNTFNQIVKENKQYNKQIKIKCKNDNCQIQTTSIQYNSKISCFTYNTNIKEICDINNIFNHFNDLPDNLVKLMNPKNALELIYPRDVFYHNYLLIPSNYIRQPNTYEDKSFDPFTSELNGLVKTLKNEGLIGYKKSQNLFDTIDNNQGDNPYSSVKKYNLSLLTNCVNKKSILRDSIVGKRVINTGRGVINPGTKLKIGEIEIPMYILKNLRETVYFNRITKDYILKLLRRSNEEQKFIDYVKVDYNKKMPYTIVSLHNNYKILTPEFGDQFEKILEEGEYIMFGRQPSIHPWNCQAAEIKKSNIRYPDGFERTINIPIPIAPSQNADYDGDEMLLKKFSNTTANIEKALILNSKKQLKHPITGTTMYGLVQDQIVGINLLLNEKNISKHNAYLILGKYVYCLFESLNTKKTFTGREILSSIFPKHFTNDNFKNGFITVKYFTTPMVACNSYNSIFNQLSHVYGDNYTVTIIDIIKEVVQNYLKYYGLSITLTNIVPDINILLEIENYVLNIVKNINAKLEDLVNDLNNNKYYISSYNDIIDIKLKNINKLNFKTQQFIEKILQKYYNQEDNLFKICYDIGYKLSINDLISILCCVGQKMNKYMPYPKINGKTSLYDISNNINLESSGFITNSYIKGLTYGQYVTMVKEESLPQIVNVTSGTSLAGSTGKKMIRMASELFLNHDKYIVSDKYIVNLNPNFLKISVSDMCKVDIILPNKTMIWYKEINNLFNNQLKEYMYYYKNKSIEIIKQLNFYINIKSEILIYYYKIKENNIKTLINHEKNLILIKNFYNTIYNKYYYQLNDINYILYIFLIYFDPSGYIFKNDNDETNISNYFTEDLLTNIFNKIMFKLDYSLSPGFMYGYYISNTLQERFTQQTLSSFHTTTKSNAKVERGLTEEFKQLLELTKKDEDIVICNSYDLNFLKNIKNLVEHISLKILCSNIELVEETEDNYFIYCCYISVPILLQKNVNMIILHKMVKTYCNRCFSIQNYCYYFDINKDIIKLYICVKFNNTVSKNIDINLDILKYYFKTSLWDGIHNGKIINTNLEIETIPRSIINDNNEIEIKNLYSLKFFIESVADFIYIDTSELESIYVTPWISYNIGGIQYMKINTLSKVNKLINDENFIYCLKHLFDYRFFSSKPTNIKILNNKSEIIKQANNGDNNIITHAAMKGLTDKCTDIYSSLFVSQKPNMGTNYYNFYINPNLFDQYEYVDKQELLLSDNEKILSVL